MKSFLFRLLVFALMHGPVLWVYVKRCEEDELLIDLDFLGGIHVAKSELPGVGHAFEVTWK